MFVKRSLTFSFSRSVSYRWYCSWLPFLIFSLGSFIKDFITLKLNLLQNIFSTFNGISALIFWLITSLNWSNCGQKNETYLELGLEFGSYSRGLKSSEPGHSYKVESRWKQFPASGTTNNLDPWSELLDIWSIASSRGTVCQAVCIHHHWI